MLLAWNKIIPIYRPITTANDSLRGYPVLFIQRTVIQPSLHGRLWSRTPECDSGHSTVSCRRSSWMSWEQTVCKLMADDNAVDGFGRVI